VPLHRAPLALFERSFCCIGVVMCGSLYQLAILYVRIYPGPSSRRECWSNTPSVYGRLPLPERSALVTIWLLPRESTSADAVVLHLSVCHQCHIIRSFTLAVRYLIFIARYSRNAVFTSPVDCFSFTAPIANSVPTRQSLLHVM
jgi:hypothetical protein